MKLLVEVVVVVVAVLDVDVVEADLIETWQVARVPSAEIMDFLEGTNLLKIEMVDKPPSERHSGFSRGYRTSEDGDGGKQSERHGYGGPRGGFRGERRGGFNNGEVGEGEQNRRPYERRSGTGRGLVFLVRCSISIKHSSYLVFSSE